MASPFPTEVHNALFAVVQVYGRAMSSMAEQHSMEIAMLRQKAAADDLAKQAMGKTIEELKGQLNAALVAPRSYTPANDDT